MSAPRVLFQLSGSIAAYKACHVVSRLVQDGCEVQTVATPAALRFVGEATLEGLTGRPVATEVFERGRQMDHIHLIRRADLVVLCPATAGTINRLASGIADDLVSTLFLAHDFDKPYVLVPAMNVAMWRHPATQRGLAQLREWGVDVLEPGAGSLACGEVGEGRLLEPEVILDEVRRRLSLRSDGAVPADPPADRSVVPSALASIRRVLITSGGTTVPIDGVRSIGNTSTGSTGATLAAAFADAGHAVTLVHAADAVVPTVCSPGGSGVRLRSYVTFGDLDTALREMLAAEPFDAVIHLAAVSDYDVDHLEVDGRRVEPDPNGKLASGSSLSVHLRTTPKLLPRLASFAADAGHPAPLVVGFKLTNGATLQERAAAVAKIADGVDAVVHNDLTEIGADGHVATVWRAGSVVSTCATKAELAAVLLALVSEHAEAEA
ncbi:MAG: bifunctional phosphopantothenoylcysteine decarboxylase/phosphopantothenate--cysteine ligase CoaBC [Desertimonas sp.]